MENLIPAVTLIWFIALVLFVVYLVLKHLAEASWFGLLIALAGLGGVLILLYNIVLTVFP